MPCRPKISTWSGKPNRPRSSTVRPDTTATGVRAASATTSVEHAGQQPGVVGVGDDRRQHAVDVEADEQRPGQRAPRRPPRPPGRRRRADGSVTAVTGTVAVEVGEEAFGPSLHVAAPHDLAQAGHAGPALVAVHLDGRHDRLPQGVLVVGVDEHGVGQLVGGAGELRQHQHAVTVEARS